jgi:hypothetical protein
VRLLKSGMLKNLFRIALVAVAAVLPAAAQTYTYPALSTNNTFTGTNNFSGSVQANQLTLGSTSGLLPGYLVTMPFSSVYIVGIAQDPYNNTYVMSSTTGLQQFSTTTGTPGYSNATPTPTSPSGLNHVGGITSCGSSRTLVCAIWTTKTGSVFTNLTVAEYAQTAGLPIVTTFPLTGATCDGAGGLAYQPSTDTLFCASYGTLGTTLDEWNLTSQTEVGALTLSSAVPRIQGLGFNNLTGTGFCAYSDDSAQQIGYLTSISLSGVVTPYGYNGGIIPQVGELEGGTCENGTWIYPEPVNGPVVAILPSSNNIGVTNDGFVIQSNMITNNGNTANPYTNPPGGLGFASGQFEISPNGALMEWWPAQTTAFNQYSGYQFGINSLGQFIGPGGWGIGSGATIQLSGLYYGESSDPTYFYGSAGNGYFSKYLLASPWTLVAQNTTAAASMGIASIKQPQCVSGLCYVPGWNGAECSTRPVGPYYNGAVVGIFNASTLAWQSNIVLGSSALQAPTGAAVDAPDNLLTLNDICDQANMYQFNLTTGAYIGTLPYGSNIFGPRGLSWNNTTQQFLGAGASQIFIVGKTGGIVSIHNSPITGSSPEGVDANCGANGCWVQNGIVYPISLSSCCGLEYYGVDRTVGISASDTVIATAVGVFGDSGYKMPQSYLATMPGANFNNNTSILPATTPAGSNTYSSNFYIYNWCGVCSTPGKMASSLQLSLGALSNSSAFLTLTAPTANGTGWSGTSIFELAGWASFYVGTSGTPVPLVTFTYPRFYLNAGAYTPVLNSPTTLTNNYNWNVPNGPSSSMVTYSLTTTAATSDSPTIQGVASTSHCTIAPTNASAATNIATTYISAKSTNGLTVTHTATSGMTYDITCSAM